MARKKAPSFVLELPLVVHSDQAKRLRSRLEAARCLYNALLGEALKRMQRMRNDPAWQVARAIPRSQKKQRAAAFGELRETFGFTEYALHAVAKEARTGWIADHIDAVMAQILASRAYQAVNRLCLGQAKKVRFKSRGRGLDSVENKRNDTGMRFVLQTPEQGNQGYLLWGEDRLPAIIDWHDPVVCHGLRHRIKYARLLRRKASSPAAAGADCSGYRYQVQLVLEGTPLVKPKQRPGAEIIGLDLGPSVLAIVPREEQARLVPLAEELRPDARKKRRLQRKLDRQRRANNPEHYDEQGRIKTHGGQRRPWKESQGYQHTRRRLATQERKLAAHRKSLHGRLVNEIVRVGNHIQTEKLSYRGWQKRYGRSVGLHAPGMLIDHLKRTVAKTGGILTEFATRATKLSQYCHHCKRYQKKPLSQRWHACDCGIGPVQRDLYSALLAAYLEAETIPPSIDQRSWEGAEARLECSGRGTAPTCECRADLAPLHWYSQ